MQDSALAAQGTSSAQLLDLAFSRLQAGDPQTAETMVVTALNASKGDPDAWNLAGMTAQALGAHEAAIERFDAASRLVGAHPVILTCRARSELSLGRRDAALASLTEAVSKPGCSADAMALLAGVLLDLGRRDAAARAVKSGLAAFPDQPHLTVLKGRLLSGAGDHAAALAAYRAALKTDPTIRDAHRLAAVELFAVKRYDEAAAHLAQALDLDAKDVEAWVNLSVALARCDRADQARGAARRALALAPGHGPARDAMARALAIAVDPAITDQLLDDIAEAFACPGESHGPLITLTMNILYIQTEFLRLRTALHERDWRGPLPVDEALPEERRSLLYQLAHPAFARLFANRPIPCWDTERVFASLRAGFLDLDRRGALDAEAEREPACLALIVLMARQAHLNEHIAEISDGETAQLAALSSAVSGRFGADADAPTTGDWARLALVAAYRPLAELDAADALLALADAETTPAALRAILEEQLVAPRREAGILDSIESALPEAGAAFDPVSARVRAQYEAHPYPRWTVMPTGGAEAPDTRMADVLGVMRAQTGAARSRYRVLIAGAGTGAQPIRFARRFPHAEVLAIDLSRASLAYATRKAAEFGVENVRFQQANLLTSPESAPLDEIHCSGVLHHLAEPEAGLRALVDRLAPQGLMHLALYARAARRSIEATRAAYASARPHLDIWNLTLADLRAFRRWVAREAPDSARQALPEWVDFYSASMLRDLVFPAQETTYRLSEIRSMLDRAGLRFVSFDLAHDPAVLAGFDAAYPGRRDDLDAWEEYESRQPDSFRFMYRFWVQKR